MGRADEAAARALALGGGNIWGKALTVSQVYISSSFLKREEAMALRFQDDKHILEKILGGKNGIRVKQKGEVLERC